MALKVKVDFLHSGSGKQQRIQSTLTLKNQHFLPFLPAQKRVKKTRGSGSQWLTVIVISFLRQSRPGVWKSG